VYAGQNGAFIFLAASLDGKLVVDKMADYQRDPMLNSAAEWLGALSVTTVGKCLTVYISYLLHCSAPGALRYGYPTLS
jgi:hypothetical protein